MEHHIIPSLRIFERHYGVNITAPLLVKSVETHELLYHIPVIRIKPDAVNKRRNKTERSKCCFATTLNGNEGDMVTFVSIMLNKNIRKTSRKQALEHHKAAKHQPE